MVVDIWGCQFSAKFFPKSVLWGLEICEPAGKRRKRVQGVLNSTKWVLMNDFWGPDTWAAVTANNPICVKVLLRKGPQLPGNSTLFLGGA